MKVVDLPVYHHSRRLVDVLYRVVRSFESEDGGESDIDLRGTYGRSNVHSKKAKREGESHGKSDRNKR